MNRLVSKVEENSRTVAIFAPMVSFPTLFAKVEGTDRVVRSTEVATDTELPPEQISGLRQLPVTRPQDASSADPVIDIIFVHGFGGEPRRTWTYTENQAFWPLWLPNEIGLSHANILTFGYTVSSRAWEDVIPSVAENLGHDLRSRYQEMDPVRIPKSLPCPMVLMSPTRV